MMSKEAAVQRGEKMYMGAACKRGHPGIRYTVNSDCVECSKLRTLAHGRTYYEKCKTLNEYKERYKKRKHTYAINNKAKITAKTRKYEAAKLNRTPAWLSKDDFWLLNEAYELAALRTKIFGFPWHVDHVVPLQGALVSGLHVPHNVQVIPAKQNQSKFNRYEVT